MTDVCFVTGSGGFLGDALCRRLLAEGYAVRGLDVRFPEDGATGAERLVGDVCDGALVARGCRGTACVFHLAALLPQRKASPGEMRRVNVDGARTVLETALEAGIRRLVLMSSAEVYGVPRQIPCPETAPLAPNGEYGRNKVEAEGLARETSVGGLEVVILRPPTIVGPGMPERLLRGTLRALRHGRRVLVPSGVRFQMVAVSDVVEACLAAARHPQAAGEVFNVGSESVPTLLEMTRRLRQEMGSRSPVTAVPPWLARAVFKLLLVIGRSPLEPEHVEIAFRDYVFDIEKAKRVLGWRPQMDNVRALLAAAGKP